MTNQFMQDGITYMINKAYQRGVKSSFKVLMFSCLIVGFVSFQAGRTYEYAQTIKVTAEQIVGIPGVSK